MYKVPASVAKQIQDAYNNRSTGASSGESTSPSYWGTQSLDTPEGIFSGGRNSEPDTYTAAELSDYPSPSWMAPVAEAVYTGMSGIANMAVPGLGFAMDQGKKAATDPNYSWSELGKNTLMAALTSALNSTVGSKVGELGYKVAGIPGGVVGSALQGKATKGLLSYLMSKIGSGGENGGGVSDFSQLGSMESNFDLGAFNPDAGSPFSSVTTAINSETDPYSVFGMNNSFLGNDPLGYTGQDPTSSGAPAFSSPSGQTGEVDSGYYDNADNGAGISGGGDSGGSWGTVICTELRRQGFISNSFYHAEASYGDTLPYETMEGYRAWAMPIVKLMRKSALFSKIVHFFAEPVLQEMAHRASNQYTASLMGSGVLFMALPVCNAIGSFKGRLKDNIKYA